MQMEHVASLAARRISLPRRAGVAGARTGSLTKISPQALRGRNAWPPCNGSSRFVWDGRRDPRLPLPMTRDVVPLVLNLIPSIRDPMLVTAFGYPCAGDPFKETPIPLPIARCPNISIAVQRLVFDTRRRRGRVADNVRARPRTRPWGAKPAPHNHYCQRGGLARPPLEILFPCLALSPPCIISLMT